MPSRPLPPRPAVSLPFRAHVAPTWTSTLRRVRTTPMTTEPRTDDRGRPLCEGLTKRRTRCLATALPDSPFCKDHDPRDLRRGTHVSPRIAAHAHAMATREPVPPTSHRPWCDAAAHTDI